MMESVSSMYQEDMEDMRNAHIIEIARLKKQFAQELDQVRLSKSPEQALVALRNKYDPTGVYSDKEGAQ